MFQDCKSPQHDFKTNFMRDKRKTWALEDDVDLLNQLEKFSQRLVNRTHGLIEKVEDFEKKLIVARIEVKTLSNNFESIADNQFVENRVYDEEEDIFSCQTTKTDKSLNFNTSEDLESALKVCDNIIESKFEAVNIPLSDSDDDTDVAFNSETILVPRNRYKFRPLPHLIGGEDFFNDDSLGLSGFIDRNEKNTENIMNGEDGNVTQSESSSIDEPDESSAAHDYSITKSLDYEGNSLSDSKEQFDCLFNGQEEVGKDTNEFQARKTFVHEDNLESSGGKISESPEPSDEPKVLSKPESILSNDIPGINPRATVQDELKKLFSTENIVNGKNKLRIFDKLQATTKVLDENINSNDVTDDSKIIPRPSEQKTKPLFDYSPKKNSYNDNSTDVLSAKVSPKLQSNTFKDEENIFEEKKDLKQSKEPLLAEDNLLPSVQTDVLYSFAKERAKIKNKRRLPSRRPKTLVSPNNEDNSRTDNTKKENLVLSPSTDEEDLFVIPQSQTIKEPHASSLFSTPSLFSPGSSIEETSKTFVSNDKQEEDTSKSEKESNIFDEPLGIYKTVEMPMKKQDKKHLFKDWDPFDSDDGELFSSIDRKSRGKSKTSLFDDLESSEKLSPTNEDSLLFGIKTKTSTNLFESASSSTSFLNRNDKTKVLSSRLFSDKSDDDSGSEDNIFSNVSTSKSIFSSKSDGNNHSKNTNAKSTSILNIPEKSRKEVNINPLSDPDEELFD